MTPDDDERLDRIERKLDDLSDRLDQVQGQVRNSSRGGSGIGCLEVALFAWVLVKLYELIDLVQA